MDKKTARDRLVTVVRTLAVEKRAELERLKLERSGLDRPDFVWHYLLQSFSTMGRASGWHGLIGNKNNYRLVTYDVLSALTPEDRITQVRRVCHEARIRMPDKKAEYILQCFDYVKQLGGVESAKAKLLAQRGREAKIRFLKTFPGVGPKYARNIMMDVYHEDFRDSIALDIRIKAISDLLGISFSSYTEHESFYLTVAKDAGINGWELDRLLFNYNKEVESQLKGYSPNTHEIQDQESGSQISQTSYAKKGKTDKDAATSDSLAYKIVDDHSYSNAIRIRTKWKGRNRLLWIDNNHINEFLSHPENFKEVSRFIDASVRLTLSGRPVGGWNACLVKRKESGPGRCFIATAVYGSSSAREVVILRRFRDEVLLAYDVGKVLIKIYNKISPNIAHLISRHNTLQAVLKLLLTPITRLLLDIYERDNVENRKN